MGGEVGRLAEHRKFLIDKTQLTVLIEQLLDRGVYLLAIRAAIIEELDKRDIALRIAAYRGRRVIENLVPTFADHLHRLGVGVAVRLGFGLAQRLDQHIRILHQIIVDNRLDRLALFGWNFGGSKWMGRCNSEKPTGQDKKSKVRTHDNSRVRLIKRQDEANLSPRFPPPVVGCSR